MKKRNWYFALGGIGAAVLDVFAMIVVTLLYVVIASCREAGSSVSGTEIDNTFLEIAIIVINLGLLFALVLAVITSVKGFAKRSVPIAFIIIQLVVYVGIIAFMIYSLIGSDDPIVGIVIILLYAVLTVTYVLGTVRQIKERKPRA